MRFLKKSDKEVLTLAEYPLLDGSILPLLHFPLLAAEDFVSHCFTTRLGGVSTGIYESLNLSFTRGDEKTAVTENFRRLAQALSVSFEKIVCSDQTHTANVRRVTKDDFGNGLIREKSFFDTDGMITNEKGLVLATFYADCVPIYFIDPKGKAIGLSHSGWRGTVGRIAKATIEAMTREFQTNPQDLRCAIGPSICQDCYEISQDVADECLRAFPGQENQILVNKGNGKYQLDLWRTNEIVLLEAGVLPQHIATTNICTCCNSKLLFSHRASHGKRGNLGAFLAIKED